ncbi:MAG: hypothetical protein CM15mP117_01230 [Alphaproteobacteria bacterium]|nr:MAG: hypothetical protein CM15mP117_01230 [Alphaproteobacteria bacterium]
MDESKVTKLIIRRLNFWYNETPKNDKTKIIIRIFFLMALSFFLSKEKRLLEMGDYQNPQIIL